MPDTQVKERPILFSAHMVRAILNGSKTQTRRVIKDQPSEFWHPGPVSMYAPTKVDGHGEEYPGDEVYGAADEDEGRICPYGKPGDLLWVRETFYAWRTQIYSATGHTEGPDQCVYAADEGFLLNGAKWKPSIHMPRWASRITLEITDVRVERLQDISEEDAIAEGVEHWVVGEGWREYGLSKEDEAVCGPPMTTARDSYRTLWDSINGEGAWDKNHWIWCLTFRRLEVR